ncbi:MAG: aminotransferase class III-fold pyridoxal phosphate-dependent enzyme, partial [Flavobacteriaceae bacterium]|nr:aminotransferase class III-fold pyridoxal phosphate-dependent enzyme [Flavobacteriaceae bacterium]
MQSPSSNNTLYNKPYLGQLLSLLKMDKDYFKAEGNYLFAQDNGQVKKVLDLAGGYGSLLLGHNHPQLKDLMKELVDENSCQHHQLSKKSKANSLGSEINRLIHAETGCNYHSIILNTGAEAVEAALKHSLLAYDKKLRTIQETIDKNLLTIGESVFQNNRTAVLSFEGHEFNSISDLQSFINAFNNPYLNNYKPVILVTNKSFHGKTMGALSVTSNSYFREPFLKHSPIQSIHLDFNSDDQNELFTAQEFEVLIPQVSNSGSLTIKRKTLSRIAATIIEPVIGEGGVYVLKKEFLKRLRELTLKYKVPLIFDEVQSGCFRTGTFLASFQQGVKADYYILGKSLGGGISKISAVMIDQSYYIPEFDLIHSSTFAEDDLSCAIASRALKLMIDNKNRVLKAGDHLLYELSTLKNKYPDVIKDVRGLGLMIGINFQDFDQSRNYGLQGISRSKFFGYVLTAYLLNTKDIRVSVTMSDCRTIRILPSMFITREERDRFIFAMYELCKILEYGDFYSLISFLLPNDYRNLRPISNFNRGKIPLDPIEDCVDEVGFLLHYIDINTVRKYLNSLDLLPDEVIFNLIKTLKPFSEPVIIGRNRILNRQGKAVCIT